MSDEIEQTDQMPDAEELELAAAAGASPAEESASAAAEPTPEAPGESELETIVESLSDDEAQTSAEAGSDDVVETAETEAAAVETTEPEEAVAETEESEVVAPAEGDEPAAESLPDALADSEVTPEKLRSPVPWWPFWLLAFCWIALCGAAAYFLTRDPSMPSLRQEAYTFVVAGGLALTVLGPILAIAVWAFARVGVAQDRRPGMFVTALLRAAVITFLGVLAWTGTLIVVDALRLGLIRF